ncbi:hypothetical protein F5K02_06535 [Bacillus amyloliquefaciens]|nr:hypothetical protein B1726_08750 [Bacillus sp. LYLB4]RBY98868.1 hypothetical protein DSD26_16415 [Bacillus velezensis]UNE50513.1 hypothetical protein F5K02_06535 [Bacillus amyloliquefaciens]
MVVRTSCDAPPLKSIHTYERAENYPYELGYGGPHGFSHGANMRQLVNSFRNFILTGKCGEHWEYKEI